MASWLSLNRALALSFSLICVFFPVYAARGDGSPPGEEPKASSRAASPARPVLTYVDRRDALLAALAQEFPLWCNAEAYPAGVADVLVREFARQIAVRPMVPSISEDLQRAIAAIESVKPKGAFRQWLRAQYAVATGHSDELSPSIAVESSWFTSAPVGLVGFSISASSYLRVRESDPAKVEALRKQHAEAHADYVARVVALPECGGEKIQLLPDLLVQVEPPYGSSPDKNFADQLLAARAYAARNDANKWLAHCWLGAVYELIAQGARGTDWASEVSPERFKLVAEYSALAATEYRAALDEAPHRPFPAVSMMALSLISSDDQIGSVKTWFDRASALAPDDASAMHLYMRSCSPRWGGSPRQMREAIAQAAAVKDHQSLVPYHAFLGAQMLREDNDRGGTPMRSEEIARNVRAALEPYLKEKSPPVNESSVRSALVLVAYGQNVPAAARAHLRVPGWKLNVDSTIWGVTAGDLREWAILGSSPWAKECDAILRDLAGGKPKEASAECQRLLALRDVASDAEVAPILKRKAALASILVKFDAGEIVDLVPKHDPLVCWNVCGNEELVAAGENGEILMKKPRSTAWGDLETKGWLSSAIPVGTRFRGTFAVAFSPMTADPARPLTARERAGQSYFRLTFGDRLERNAQDGSFLPAFVASPKDLSIRGGSTKRGPKLEVAGDPVEEMTFSIQASGRSGSASLGDAFQRVDPLADDKSIRFDERALDDDQVPTGGLLLMESGTFVKNDHGPVRVKSIRLQRRP